MRAAWAAGYPVPEVFDADGRDLVMEHLAGPTMLKTLGDRPWRFGRIADQLAELHTRLAGLQIDAQRAPGEVRARRVPRAPRSAPRQRHADVPRPGRHRLVERRDGSARRRCRDHMDPAHHRRGRRHPRRAASVRRRASGDDCSAASSPVSTDPARGDPRRGRASTDAIGTSAAGELAKLRRFLEEYAAESATEPDGATRQRRGAVSSSWWGPRAGPTLACLCRRRPRSARLACGVPRRTTANDPTWVEAVPTLVMPPPPSRRDGVVDTLHGVEVADPYRWLEDGASGEVQQWVAAQNRHTRQALDSRSDRSAVARTPDRADGAPGRARRRGPRRRRRDDGTAHR